MDFSNILSLLSNINNKTNNNIKNNTSIIYNNNNSTNKKNPSSYSYPYGDFPYNYTIEGQKKLRDSIIKTNTYNFYQDENELPQNENQNTSQINNNNNINQNNINQLLPLITGLLSNKSQKNNNLFNSILPLLSGGNIDLSNIIKQTQNTVKVENTQSENILPESDYRNIESYQKVD
jgi:hypothetical protein